jgi:regulator of nonsense transcripts 2
VRAPSCFPLLNRLFAFLQTTDVDAAVKVCSQIHQLYADFTPQLIPALVKSLQAEKEDNLVRRRVLMRLIAELLLYGLYTDETVLFGALKDLLVCVFYACRRKQNSLSGC